MMLQRGPQAQAHFQRKPLDSDHNGDFTYHSMKRMEVAGCCMVERLGPSKGRRLNNAFHETTSPCTDIQMIAHHRPYTD